MIWGLCHSVMNSLSMMCWAHSQQGQLKAESALDADVCISGCAQYRTGLWDVQKDILFLQILPSPVC